MINFFKKRKKVVVADISKPTLNGNYHTESTLESMKTSIEEERIFGQLGSITNDGGLDLTKATHECVSPEIKDGKLYCEIKFLETPYVEKALGYLKDNDFEIFTFRPEGEGSVDPSTDKIYDFKLNSINIFIESDN